MKFSFLVLSTVLLLLQGCALQKSPIEKIQERRAFSIQHSAPGSQKPINEYPLLKCERVVNNMLNYECEHGITIVLNPTLSKSGVPDDSQLIQDGEYKTADYFSDDVGDDLQISYAESISMTDPNKVSPVLRFLPASDSLRSRCHNIKVSVSYNGETVTHIPYVIDEMYKSHRQHANSRQRGNVSKHENLKFDSLENDAWYLRYYQHYKGDMSAVPKDANSFVYKRRPINVYMLSQNDRTLYIKYTLNCSI